MNKTLRLYGNGPNFYARIQSCSHIFPHDVPYFTAMLDIPYHARYI
jgi:hypothetical protein